MKNIPVGRIVFYFTPWYNTGRYYTAPHGIPRRGHVRRTWYTETHQSGAFRNKKDIESDRKSMSEERHTHTAPDGTVYEHTHEHNHTHTHTNTKAVLNRLSRAIGHMESIKRMVEDGRDCSEVLVQLSAVKAAINNTAKVILKDHIEHCLVDAVESGDHEAIEELTAAIDRFMK